MYNIAADGMQAAFKRLTAFLLENRLMEDRQLIFITDITVAGINNERQDILMGLKPRFDFAA